MVSSCDAVVNRTRMSCLNLKNVVAYDFEYLKKYSISDSEVKCKNMCMYIYIYIYIYQLKESINKIF